LLDQPALAYPFDVIAPAQIRAARALIGWKQSDLAREAKVSEMAIKRLESGGSDPRVSTIDAIQRAFDQAGVVFLDDGDTRDGGAGIRFKRGSPR
jgi:predicted transcriptional regulator